MNKKIIGGASIVSLVIIIVIGGLVFFWQKPQAEIKTENASTQEEAEKDKGYRAQLDYAEGQVEKRLNAESGWITAERGDVFTTGMEVRTLVSSKAVLTFEDGSAARIDQNTQLKIITEENSIKLEMPNGAIFNKVSKNASRQYVVNSGNYSMKALGTVFSVLNEKGDDPQLLVLESQVEMKKSGENAGETATAGEKIAIANNKIEKKKIDKKDLEKEFVAWSIKEDKVAFKLDENKEEIPKEANEETNSKIILTGKSNDSGIRLTWQTENLGSFDGFKLAKAEHLNPVYPGDAYQYFAGAEIKAYTWNLNDGNKYHFRVCKYVGGKCLLYSNDVYVEAPKGNDDEEEDYATSVSLSVTEDGGDKYLKWTISGGDAPNGYKVVKAKDKNPEYPDDGYYKYISDEDTKKVKLAGFDSGDEYHFRVCIYKGGSCGAYSNDVKIEF